MFKLNQFAVLAVCGVLGACAQTTPKYDAKFGDAVRTTMQQQIINPEAGNNTDPVTGLDGKAANDVMTSYNKSFRAPEKDTNVFNIGIGGNASK